MRSKEEKDSCPACGYPLKVIKQEKGSIRQASRTKVGCTAPDCTYTEVVKSYKEKMVEIHTKVLKYPEEDE